MAAPRKISTSSGSNPPSDEKLIDELSHKLVDIDNPDQLPGLNLPKGILTDIADCVTAMNKERRYLSTIQNWRCILKYYFMFSAQDEFPTKFHPWMLSGENFVKFLADLHNKKLLNEQIYAALEEADIFRLRNFISDFTINQDTFLLISKLAAIPYSIFSLHNISFEDFTKTILALKKENILTPDIFKFLTLHPEKIYQFNNTLLLCKNLNLSDTQMYQAIVNHCDSIEDLNRILELLRNHLGILTPDRAAVLIANPKTLEQIENAAIILNRIFLLEPAYIDILFKYPEHAFDFAKSLANLKQNKLFGKFAAFICEHPMHAKALSTALMNSHHYQVLTTELLDKLLKNPSDAREIGAAAIAPFFAKSERPPQSETKAITTHAQSPESLTTLHQSIDLTKSRKEKTSFGRHYKFIDFGTDRGEIYGELNLNKGIYVIKRGERWLAGKLTHAIEGGPLTFLENKEFCEKEVEIANKAGFNCMRVKSHFSEKDFSWMIAMELMPVDLEAFLQTHPFLPDVTRYKLVSYIFNGVQRMHEAGIVHRDIKPQNIMVLPKGIQIIDFGIAVDRYHLIDTGSVGTYPYIARELSSTSLPPLEETDVHSAGCVASDVFGFRLFHNQYFYEIRTELPKEDKNERTELEYSLRGDFLKMLHAMTADKRPPMSMFSEKARQLAAASRKIPLIVAIVSMYDARSFANFGSSFKWSQKCLQALKIMDKVVLAGTEKYGIEDCTLIERFIAPTQKERSTEINLDTGEVFYPEKAGQSILEVVASVPERAARQEFDSDCYYVYLNFGKSPDHIINKNIAVMHVDNILQASSQSDGKYERSKREHYRKSFLCHLQKLGLEMHVSAEPLSFRYG